MRCPTLFGIWARGPEARRVRSNRQRSRAAPGKYECPECNGSDSVPQHGGLK
jgi:hypothetical protein